MPAPPLSARFLELLHKHLARRMSEITVRTTQACRGAAEAHEFRVIHFAETCSHFFELVRLESYRTHVLSLANRWFGNGSIGRISATANRTLEISPWPTNVQIEVECRGTGPEDQVPNRDADVD
jgi:hypothetical protein